ncbi:MAG: hypothetical protein U0793_30515 [Gemmataceae bacterium]
MPSTATGMSPRRQGWERPKRFVLPVNAEAEAWADEVLSKMRGRGSP